MKKLDKSKPYEEVYGAPGISYHQDGVPFDKEGNEVRLAYQSRVDDCGGQEQFEIGEPVEAVVQEGID